MAGAAGGGAAAAAAAVAAAAAAAFTQSSGNAHHEIRANLVLLGHLAMRGKVMERVSGGLSAWVGGRGRRKNQGGRVVYKHIPGYKHSGRGRAGGVAGMGVCVGSGGGGVGMFSFVLFGRSFVYLYT